MPTLLYVHGFNSSPQSKKAQQTQSWFALNAPEITFICPPLSPFANNAMATLRTIIEDRAEQPIYLVGSSMGGFFATCLIEHYNLRGVLINPAVSPGRGLNSWLGENTNYMTGEKWIFEPCHIDQYLELDAAIDSLAYKNNYHVLLQSGDQVLDYRDAQIRYQGSSIVVEEGGDHSFINYEQHLAGIHQFLTSTQS
jgi:predicted esterase YcpF (UPF0227 family)